MFNRPTDTEPRGYTPKEGRTMLLDYLQGVVEFWKRAGDAEDEKLDGIVFSVLAMIDGVAGFMPAFKLIPDPHPDDEAFSRGEGENWWTAEDICEDEHLHESWARKDWR